jgi:hypothetical protein
MTFVLWEISGHDNVLGGVGLRTKGYALFILDHRGDTVNCPFPKTADSAGDFNMEDV